MKHDLTTGEIATNLKMGMMGKRIRDGYAKQHPPVGDRMINTVRGAIWEAWEKGLDDKDGSIYPSVPLLDRLTEKTPEPEEPEP